MKLKLVFSAVIIILLIGCTIQKRHYQSGFYFQFNPFSKYKKELASMPVRSNLKESPTVCAADSVQEVSNFYATSALESRVKSNETRTLKKESFKNTFEKTPVAENLKNALQSKAFEKPIFLNPDPNDQEQIDHEKIGFAIVFLIVGAIASLLFGFIYGLGGIFIARLLYGSLALLGISFILLIVFIIQQAVHKKAYRKEVTEGKPKEEKARLEIEMAENDLARNKKRVLISLAIEFVLITSLILTNIFPIMMFLLSVGFGIGLIVALIRLLVSAIRRENLNKQ